MEAPPEAVTVMPSYEEEIILPDNYYHDSKWITFHTRKSIQLNLINHDVFNNRAICYFSTAGLLDVTDSRDVA